MVREPEELGMEYDRGLHEECGVFGVYDLDGGDVASTVYYGLFALQHRGQESCGIAVSDTNGPMGKVVSHKDMGLANEVFDTESLEKLKGNIGVGHVRYSTAGSSTRDNAQPLVLNYVKGILALAHNGNLINAPELRTKLSYTGAIFRTTIDSEVIAYYIARERLKTHSVEEAVAGVMNIIKGAYSLIVMSPRKLIGARDPLGFKPLCIGKRDRTYVLASESCALDAVGAEFVRDVLPGEIVAVTPDGIFTNMREESAGTPKESAGTPKESAGTPSGGGFAGAREESAKTPSGGGFAGSPENTAKCIFEYIYFARPDSRIDGVSVYNSRIMAGRILAQDYPVDADLVVGVPESGNVAALGYSLESGIPYGIAFVKNSYVGRTFIKPGQSQRESGVRIKLNVVREAVAGKRIVMIDDSIVRGTTSARIVKMLKEAGAAEVHVRISSPPFMHPCYFGTDVPSDDQLIAHDHTVEQICEYIGADSLGYIPVDRLGELIGQSGGYCDACFTGNYPIEPPTEDIRGEYER